MMSRSWATMVARMLARRDDNAPVEANGGDVVSAKHSFAGHACHHSRPYQSGCSAVSGLVGSNVRKVLP